MATVSERDRGLLHELLADGRPALTLTASRCSCRARLPSSSPPAASSCSHDVAYLGMSADQLCRLADCRIVRFMFHDRVAFGGTLIAAGVLYLWLQAFPLRLGAAWAWWAAAISGALGFASFLAYLRYGYLDSWHGMATMTMLPVFGAGLLRSRRVIRAGGQGWLTTADGLAAPTLLRVGRWGLLGTGLGLTLAGLVILYLGSTEVFVAEALAFMGLTRDALDAVSPRLVPLIAHDRAGVGGGLATTGVLLLICGWYAPPDRAWHEAVGVAGAAGFGCAIGTHFVEGHTNVVHLAPAFTGALLFVASFTAEVMGARRQRAR